MPFLIDSDPQLSYEGSWKPSFHSSASSASLGPAPTLSLISGRPSTRHRGLSCPRRTGPRVICSADRQTQDAGRLEPACRAPRPPSPNQNPPKTPQRARKPHGVNYFHSPSCMWHTGHLVSLQGCAGEGGGCREGAPARPTLPPSSAPWAQAWLEGWRHLAFSSRTRGRRSRRWARGCGHCGGKAPRSAPPSKPWGGQAAGNRALRKDRQLPSREPKTQEFPPLLRLEERIPHLGQARSAEVTVATQSVISQHWSVYALMGSGWFYLSAIPRKLPTPTCRKRKETGEGALISTQLQHRKGAAC